MAAAELLLTTLSAETVYNLTFMQAFNSVELPSTYIKKGSREDGVDQLITCRPYLPVIGGAYYG